MENNILDYLDNLRRESYVRAVIRASESDDVVGYMGMNIPVKIFYEHGLMAVPVYGIDEDILRFSEEDKNLCPLIDATLTYAKTDKCPLIHSSKLIVLENFCPVFTREFLKLKNKRIYIYNGNDDELKLKLNEVYGNFIPSETEYTDINIDFLREKLTPIQFFTVKYFVNFLDLSERSLFIEKISDGNFDFVQKFVKLIYHCPECRGNYKEEFFNG